MRLVSHRRTTAESCWRSRRSTVCWRRSRSSSTSSRSWPITSSWMLGSLSPSRRYTALPPGSQLFFSPATEAKRAQGLLFLRFQDNRVHIGPKMEIRVVTLGLDGAGKTTILFKLKQDEFMQPIPTIGKAGSRIRWRHKNTCLQCCNNVCFLFFKGFNVETVEYKNLKFTIWDVGGKHKLRPLWKHYYLNTQGTFYM